MASQTVREINLELARETFEVEDAGEDNADELDEDSLPKYLLITRSVHEEWGSVYRNFIGAEHIAELEEKAAHSVAYDEELVGAVNLDTNQELVIEMKYSARATYKEA